MQSGSKRLRGRYQKELKFVDRNLKQKRNGMKVGYNFVPTLPVAMCDDSNCKPAKQPVKPE